MDSNVSFSVNFVLAIRETENLRFMAQWYKMVDSVVNARQ